MIAPCEKKRKELNLARILQIPYNYSAGERGKVKEYNFGLRPFCVSYGYLIRRSCVRIAPGAPFLPSHHFCKFLKYNIQNCVLLFGKSCGKGRGGRFLK